MTQKPHGLEVGFSSTILNSGEVIEEHLLSNLEAYIHIKNGNTKEEVKLPMRSFLSTFINSLHGFLSGDGGLDTKRSTADIDSSASLTRARALGMVIGHGQTDVALSETDLVQKATHASIAYGDTTLVAPYVSATNPNKLSFALRRLFTNGKYTDIILYELGIKNRPVSASVASNATGTLLTRDLLYPNEGSEIQGITVGYESAIQFQFQFNVNQITNGGGGAVLNFAKLIYNLMFAGDPNSSKLLNTSSAQITFAYATHATCGATNGFTVDSIAADTDYGILAGYYSVERDNPPISADETTFVIQTANLTYGVTSISAVTNPETKVAKFTVTRDITNSGTSSIYLDRVGLKLKGGAFIAINRPNNNTFLELAPNQILRTTYSFQIRA